MGRFLGKGQPTTPLIEFSHRDSLYAQTTAFSLDSMMELTEV
jgi:hypothetical protein